MKKQIVVSLTLLGLIAFIGIMFLFIYASDTYSNMKIVPGQEWVIIYNEDNPYKDNDTAVFKVVDDKDGYSKLVSTKGDTIIRSNRVIVNVYKLKK